MQMQSLRDIFLYLERSHLIKHHSQAFENSPNTFWQIGLGTLKVKMTHELRKKLVDGVLFLIGQDRIDEKMSNRDLIAKLIHVILALDFYKDSFE